MNNIEQKRKEIKEIIKANGSRIMRVSFEKKDGTIRHMQVNPRFIKGLVEEYKSESTKQAVETRKRNNPNLLSVMDMGLKRQGNEDKKCWRSINMDTVVSVKAGGKLHEWG